MTNERTNERATTTRETRDERDKTNRKRRQHTSPPSLLFAARPSVRPSVEKAAPEKEETSSPNFFHRASYVPLLRRRERRKTPAPPSSAVLGRNSDRQADRQSNGTDSQRRCRRVYSRNLHNSQPFGVR
mmetsp:Transcript_19870/g.63956  ORF Transcript_19870/g.63956 Transcript_19870/m.63956 type:complete len:129 (-) Transcript_19870:38-424(-)